MDKGPTGFSLLSALVLIFCHYVSITLAEDTQAVVPLISLSSEVEAATGQAMNQTGSGQAAIIEEDFAKWGEAVTELLGQLQEGPAKSLQDFYEETALLKATPGKGLRGKLHKIEEAIRAFEEGTDQLETHRYKEAHAKFTESARNYELSLKGLPIDSSLAAMVCYNMGQVYTRLMDWNRAEETLLKSMDINRLLGKGKDLSHTYNSLGIASLRKGNKETAALYFEESVNSAKKAGSLEAVGAALGNLGMAYYLRGDLKRALQSYDSALQIQQKLGHQQWEAKYLSNQGLIYQHQDKLEHALHAYNKALKLNREIGLKREEANNLGSIGVVYNFQKKWEESLKAYNEALTMHRELGLRREEAKDLGNIGIAYQSQGRLAEALEAHKESMQIHKKLGNLRGEAKDLNNIAVIYHSQGKTTEALSAYEEAYNLFLFLKAPVEMEVVKENIARIKDKAGEKR
jgi:tetratricopeptide (TPR) repeat protein